jgi:MFS family permease
MTISSFITGPAFFAGSIISVILVTLLSDSFGRLPMLVIGVTGNTITLIGFVLYANPLTCLMASFFIGFFTMANNSCSFNYIVDSIPKKYRESFPSLLNIAWASGQAVIALIMWSNVQWRTLCIVMIAFSIAFYLPLMWIRESPKFYMAHRKLFKAKVRLQHIARINGANITNLRLVLSKMNTEEKMSFSKHIRLMCCDSHNLCQILIITFLFSIGNMIFYAMSLNIENMAGNPYVNGISLAIAEAVGYGGGGLLLFFIGAKISIILSFLITNTGLACLFFYWNDPFKSTVFAFMGKLGSASVDNLLYTMSGLVFPTEILGGALGIALLETRVGNFISKPLILLGHEVMCGIMFVLGVVATLLPLSLKIKRDEDKVKNTK